MASFSSLLLLLIAMVMLIAISAHPHHHHRHHRRHHRRYVDFNIPPSTYTENDVEYLEIPDWMDILKSWTKQKIHFVKGGILGNFAEGRKNCGYIVSAYSYRHCGKLCNKLEKLAIDVCDNRNKVTKDEMIVYCCPPADD